MVDTAKPKASHAGDALDVYTKPLAPIKRIGLHLCALHGYSGNIKQQVIAHHFCSHVSEEMHQCVIYDSNKPDAKLIGIEYLVSERIFNTLDSDEKRYWHSHKFEVGSGMLTAPDLSTTEENKVVEQIANMYGKIIHTWAIDENPQLPIGPPRLMMSVTAEKYLDKEVANKLQQELNYNFNDSKQQRSELKINDKLEGSDQWMDNGIAQVLTFQEKKDINV